MALLDLKNLELKDKFTQFITPNVPPLMILAIEKPIEIVKDNVINTQTTCTEFPDTIDICNFFK